MTRLKCRHETKVAVRFRFPRVFALVVYFQRRRSTAAPIRVYRITLSLNVLFNARSVACVVDIIKNCDVLDLFRSTVFLSAGAVCIVDVFIVLAAIGATFPVILAVIITNTIVTVCE